MNVHTGYIVCDSSTELYKVYNKQSKELICATHNRQEAINTLKTARFR
jgi:hypothetical protein